MTSRDQKTSQRPAWPACGFALLLLAGCGGATDAPPLKVAAMLKIAGDGQRGAAGDPLPVRLVVEVQDGSGRAARGAPVTWTVTAGGGRIEPEQPTAGGDGRVTARWILGPGLGAQEVVATAGGGEPMQFSATAVAGPAASIAKLAGDAQAGRAGAPLPAMPEVRVTDAHGNPVEGAAVQWSPSGGGSVSPASSTTDAAGLARTRWTLARAASRQQLSAAVSGAAPVSFEGTAGPNVRSIAPGAFGGGDTVAIGGYGLAGAVVDIGGVTASTVQASDTLLRVIAPTSPIPCTEVRPRLTVRLTAAGATMDTVAESLGAPLPGPGTVGRHAVLASVGRAGCRVVLEPGTYGVAVYRTLPASPAVPNNFPQAYDTARVHATLAVRPIASTAATSWRMLTLAPHAGAALAAFPASPPDVWLPAGATAPARVCSRLPGAVGDTIRLIDAGPIAGPTPGGTTLYRIRYTTPHFNWLFTDTLTIPSWIAPELPDLIRRAESDLYPILERTFGPLPDLDSNGRLNVVVAKMGSAGGFFGGTEIYADGGCKSGDFVWLSSGNAFWGNLAHEATHWIDLTRPGLGQKPWWSLEGFAVLADYYTRFEDVGKPFWGANLDYFVPIVNGHNHGGYVICMPLNGEYWPIPENPYGPGCAMLRYLADQALVPGQSGAALMRKLLDRSSHGDLRPLFRQLGGEDRTEEELMGEYLLSLYADDYVAGIGSRLVNRTFGDLREAFGTLGYEFPKLTLRATTAQAVDIPLRTPDGIVVEVEVQERSIVTLGPADPRLSLAIVRRQ